MNDKEAVIAGLRNLARDRQYKNHRQGRTGGYFGGVLNPDPTAGLRPGRIWIREGEDGTRAQSEALIVGIVDVIADIPVWLAETVEGGELCVLGPVVTTRNLESWGGGLPSTGVPRQPSVLTSQLTKSDNIMTGRIGPSTAFPSTLYVYIQPFWIAGKQYGGVDHDVGSANVPGSANQHRWCMICVDKDNATYTLTGTTVSRAGVNLLLLDTGDVDMTVPAGYIPVGMVSLSYGQTDISSSRFEDVREWIAARGTLLSEDAETLTIASGAVTAGGGSYFILAAESGTADNLDTITASGVPRMIVLQADTGDTITVKHSTDNIELNSGTDYALTGDKTLALFWDGTNLSDIGATIAGGNVDITSLTATTTVDATADYLVIYDDSAGANRKVQPQYLPNSSSNLDWIVIRDKKTQNTVGGTFTSGAWQTRTLNEELVDPGGHASLSSNQITLVAGTYRCEIRCPALQVNSHQARLQDITNTATLVTGTSEYTRSSDTIVSNSVIVGRFTLAGSTVVEVQHRCSSTSPDTQGFGVPANLTDEVYTIAQFWKEA